MPTPIEAINGRTTRFEFETTAEAYRFEAWFNKQHPGKFPDGRIDMIFGDLKSGRFWAPLSLLDGPENRGLVDQNSGRNADQRVYDDLRRGTRRWTMDTFTKPELDAVVDIAINLALKPEYINAPGHERGHSILLSHMVDKPGSLFADEVTPEGRRRLVNGAFWEELGYAVGAASWRLNDILVNHGSELDPSLAADGIRHLYQRNRNLTTYDTEKVDMDMDKLPADTLDAYLGFIKKVAKEKDEEGEKAVSDEIVDQLLLPYILAVTEPDDENPYYLRFGPKYNFDTDEKTIPTDGYEQKLQDPIIQDSLARSGRNRRILGDRLADNVLSDPDIHTASSFKIIEAIGGEAGDKVLMEVLTKAGEYTSKRDIISIINGLGSPLTDRAIELTMLLHASPQKGNEE